METQDRAESESLIPSVNGQPLRQGIKGELPPQWQFLELLLLSIFLLLCEFFK